MEIDREIFSVVILLLLLIHFKMDLVSYDQKYVYWLTATKFSQEKSVVRLTERLDMTIAVDLDIKT